MPKPRAAARSSARRNPNGDGGPVGSAHRLGSAPVCEERWTGRRARRAAHGARPARLVATVALPRYRGVIAGAPVERMSLSLGGYTHDVVYFEAPMGDGARALLIECPELFDRDTLYGPDNTEYQDNPRRFAVLVRAALEFVARRGVRPTVVHAHDWQAGLAPVYLKSLLRRASRARRGAERDDHSQSGVPGSVRAGLAAAPRSRVGSVRDGPARVLGTHQLPEGRHHRRGLRHDSQSAVRGGDPDDGGRVRLRRHHSIPARPARRAS